MAGAEEHRDVHFQSIDKFKPELTVFDGVEHRDAEFFLSFADSAFGRRFTGIDLSTGAVDLARPEAAFFADQEDMAPGFIDDEEQRGANAGLPIVPVHGHGGGIGHWASSSTVGQAQTRLRSP